MLPVDVRCGGDRKLLGPAGPIVSIGPRLGAVGGRQSSLGLPGSVPEEGPCLSLRWRAATSKLLERSAICCSLGREFARAPPRWRSGRTVLARPRCLAVARCFSQGAEVSSSPATERGGVGAGVTA
jgi:hypothetical protein